MLLLLCFDGINYNFKTTLQSCIISTRGWVNMSTIIKKISPYPMLKILRFLDNFKDVFGNYATLHSAERYFTGLLSDIPYKNCGMMAEYMEGTSEQALEQFISSASSWSYEKLNCRRVQHMLEDAVADDGIDGMLIFDDTGIEKKVNVL